MWGEPSVFLKRQLDDIQHLFASEAEGIPLYDLRSELRDLVGPADNYEAPVHRWYPYKESFSFKLPGVVQRHLKVKPAGTAIDVFAGVGTTALALQGAGFDEVIGVEYSPFSHFVGKTKLCWSKLQPKRLEKAVQFLLDYEVSDGLTPPALSSFQNPDIFDEDALHSLLSARVQIDALDVWPDERSFLLLGLAAVVEEVSGVMKDGRALRILHDRKRTSRMLTARHTPPVIGDPVRDSLAVQLFGMKEDIEDWASHRKAAKETATYQLRGDARELAQVKISPRKPAFGAASASFSVFSPPYLNCIDYSEIYKLELWMLELVKSKEEFRELRLGTLRSHPSVDFPDRGYLEAASDPFVELVDTASSFIERNHVQPVIGRMVRNYFDDMYRVLAQQAWVLQAGAWMVCIVGNSTFSRRILNEGKREELWRIPLLTDVILARMAKALGFEDVQIWTARDLRARNVRDGVARESAVVARKAG